MFTKLKNLIYKFFVLSNISLKNICQERGKVQKFILRKKLCVCVNTKEAHKKIRFEQIEQEEKKHVKFIIRKTFFSSFLLTEAKKYNIKQQIGCDLVKKFAEGNVNIFLGKYYEKKNQTANINLIFCCCCCFFRFEG